MELDRTANLAGLLCPVVVVTGVFSHAYVTLEIVAFPVLVLALIRLFRRAGRGVAVLRGVCAVASVPIAPVNVQNKLDNLSLVSGTSYPTTLPMAGAQV